MGNFTQDNRLLSIKTPFPDNFLLINSMKATEGISQLFKIEVELLHEEKEGFTIPEVVDPKKILGQPVSITTSQQDGRAREFNGIVSEFSQGSRGSIFTQYWITVVPLVWTYGQRMQSRIFQHKTVPTILKDVFQDIESSIVWEFEYEYKPRNYCVQYRETDFDFASRLMEEEGIYYYFEHKDEKHKLIVSDKPRFSRDCPGKVDVTYTYVATDDKQESHISEWETDYKLQPGMVSFRDHHIQQPGKKLAVTSASKFQVGNNEDWEIYDYPGGYARKFDGIDAGGGDAAADLNHIIPDGNRVAQTAMEVIDARHKLGSGQSDVSTLTPGHKFKVAHHPVADLNGEYVITAITHDARQTPEYTEEGNDLESAYRNSFKAMSHGRTGAVPFRPEPVTPRPHIYGAQTASVVGPSGEEIYTDDYGRIKVQFHWDREGQTDGSDSCWAPVAQAWAGNGWGTMFIPRVGMEVIVHFIDGNPDNPIVTGCVYHPMNMPPYELPKHKTRSTIKSDSTTGGGGFNEIRFEDDKGHEQIFIHGEKDIDVRIKNDRREWTGNEQHLIVKSNSYAKVEGDNHFKLSGSSFEQIDGSKHLAVSGSENIKIDGSLSSIVNGSVDSSVSGSKAEEVGGSLYLKGMSVVLEGMTQITLKGPGGFVDIGPAGVSIVGTLVNINSGGAAGVGSPPVTTSPTAPDEAAVADDDKPGSKMKLEKQSLERKKKKPKKDEEPTSWIEVKLVDEEDNPVPGESYEVVEADGTTHTGTLDKNGKAHVKLSKPGNCKVSFPRLDQGAWEDA